MSAPVNGSTHGSVNGSVNGSVHSDPGFDRIRPRRPGPVPGHALRPRDPDGRERLYSAVNPVSEQGERRPLPFAATVECSKCHACSTSTLPRAVIQSLPGLHLPWVKRGYGSFMRCPSCKRFRWMSIRIGY